MFVKLLINRFMFYTSFFVISQSKEKKLKILDEIRKDLVIIREEIKKLE
jgi:c-di-AMP phosphodiesterase-like protein